MAGGYDGVLVGLDRLEVRLGNRVLAGEPVGTMSKTSQRPRLYFELRQSGRGFSPVPYMAVTLRKAKRS
jgi:septal ring factor EnvC (AmiA/AmiB activator)